MKGYIALVITVAMLLGSVVMSQITIRQKSATIKVLQKVCAIYHRKLTGEPHPFYSEK